MTYFELFDTFGGGAATAIAIISGVYGAATIRKRRKERLYYSLDDIRYIRQGVPPEFDITVSHKGRTAKSICVSILVLSNRSPSILTDQDFTKEPEIRFSEDATILSATVLCAGKNAAMKVVSEGERILLRNWHLPRRSGIVLQIAHDKKSLPEIDFYLKSGPEPKLRKLRAPPALLYVWILIILSILLASLFEIFFGKWAYYAIAFAMLLPIIISYQSLRKYGWAWRVQAWVRGLNDSELNFLRIRNERKLLMGIDEMLV